jgi:hypothetical protein
MYASEKESAMELIAAVVILALLGILAQRFGYDSRDGMHSKEHDLARIGLKWEAPRERMRHPRPVDTPRPLDHVVAGFAVRDQPIAAPPKAA